VTTKYPHVFQPLKIGPVEVPNRFYFSPHGNPGWVLAVNGSPSEDYAAYYAERAAGGVGLLIHSMIAIPRGHFQRQSPHSEDTIPSFKAVADGVHRNGAKIFAQLHYSQAPRWDPSGPPAPHFGSVGSPVVEIEALVAAMRQCADHLRQAGYDGIEVHCNHGSIEEQFLSPYWNKRTDAYGGSLEGRMRFLVELLEAARAGAGPKLAVGVRYNVDELIEGGLTQEDTREILPKLVERKLVDFVDYDLSLEPQQHPLALPTYFTEPLYYKKYVAAVRASAASIPALSVLTRVTSVADAERVIAEGVVDMVGAARGLIAEPELVKNAREGHEDRSRICIAANMCRNANFVNGGWGCAINPGTGREQRWGVATWKPAAHRSKVVVVGGGPAGLEAARTAALRGHDVVLLESKDRLGGQLLAWGTLPDRGTVRTTPIWYQRRLTELGVTVRTGIEATASSILAERPDAVILATGARYVTRLGPPEEPGDLAVTIPGSDRDFVHSPEQILEEGTRPSGTVVVFDAEGLNTGSGIAELLAQQAGNRVHLVTNRPRPADRIAETIEIRHVLPRLRALNVELEVNTFLKEIGDHQVTLYDNLRDREKVVSGVDHVVLVTMRSPRNALARELEGRVAQLFPIGDALEPRTLMTATYEGQYFARLIGEDGAPRDFTEAFWKLPPEDKVLRRAAAIAR